MRHGSGEPRLRVNFFRITLPRNLDFRQKLDQDVYICENRKAQRASLLVIPVLYSEQIK